MWFKTVIRKDGSVASHVEVSAAFLEKGERVIFTEAKSKEEALIKAVAQWKLERSPREQRAIVESKCLRCGDKSTSGHRFCDSCSVASISVRYRVLLEVSAVLDSAQLEEARSWLKLELGRELENGKRRAGSVLKLASGQ